MKRIPTRDMTAQVVYRFRLRDGKLWRRKGQSEEFKLATNKFFAVARSSITARQIIFYLTYNKWPEGKLTKMPWEDSAHKIEGQLRSFTVNIDEDDYVALKDHVTKVGKTFSVFVRAAIREKMKRDKNDTARPINPQSPAAITIGGKERSQGNDLRAGAGGL